MVDSEFVPLHYCIKAVIEKKLEAVASECTGHLVPRRLLLFSIWRAAGSVVTTGMALRDGNWRGLAGMAESRARIVEGSWWSGPLHSCRAL